MTRAVSDRLDDILERIALIDNLLTEKTKQDLSADPNVRAAFERHLEVISEASRHIPQAMKEVEASIPWHDIANIGNHLRHGYEAVSFTILWNIREAGSLKKLQEVVTRMKAGL
jgi:uncharacterized protein with HEPN domain